MFETAASGLICYFTCMSICELSGFCQIGSFVYSFFLDFRTFYWVFKFLELHPPFLEFKILVIAFLNLAEMYSSCLNLFFVSNSTLFKTYALFFSCLSTNPNMEKIWRLKYSDVEFQFSTFHHHLPIIVLLLQL